MISVLRILLQFLRRRDSESATLAVVMIAQSMGPVDLRQMADYMDRLADDREARQSVEQNVSTTGD